jgi:hypothetical protein
MNPTVKAQWVAALRAGAHPQGFLKLATRRTEDGVLCLCAMGVLAELAVRAGALAPGQLAPYDQHRSLITYGECTTTLPYPAVTWAGLSDPHVFVQVDGQPFLVSTLNDLRRLSFAELADLVEADPTL